jgi:hypothetical protein
MKRLFTITGLIMSLVLWTTASGVQFPEYYPQQGFQRTGIIDRIDFGSREIVINDSLFTMAESVELNSLSKQGDSLGRLHKGVRIGYSYKKVDGDRLITTIWLLPSHYGQSRD